MISKHFLNSTFSITNPPHITDIPELQQIFGLADGNYYMDDNYIFDASTNTFGLTNIMHNHIASQFASQSSAITTNPTFIGNTNINNGVDDDGDGTNSNILDIFYNRFDDGPDSDSKFENDFYLKSDKKSICSNHKR